MSMKLENLKNRPIFSHLREFLMKPKKKKTVPTNCLVYTLMNFSALINIPICAKLSKSIFCIKRAANKLSLKSLRSLYFALVHPHLLYCNNIITWSSEKISKNCLNCKKGNKNNFEIKN